MLLRTALAVLLCFCSTLSPCLAAFSYGVTPVRGVNLGGWLILEKWITPSLFSDLPSSVVDEYTLCQYLGPVNATARLTSHWNTWVAESDIVAMKNAGINHLRIPFGYWAFEIPAGEPWVNGSWTYALKAIGWAKKYGMQVMIDLHGLPGSQNGQDHSGRQGNITFYYNDANLALATRVVSKVAQALSTTDYKDTVTIIQVSNEPILWGSDYNYRLGRLQQYYNMAYKEVRKYTSSAYVAVHDAFIDPSNWYYLSNSSYSLVMLDTHYYQVFGAQYQNLTCDQQRDYPCNLKSVLQTANQKIKVVVGEWSLATPQNCGNQSAFARNQIGVFENAGTGWFMWSFKNGQGWNEWDFLASNTRGWIPKLGSTKIIATC